MSDSPTSPFSNTSASPPPTSMPHNRSKGRDVHFYDANNPTAALGGLLLTNAVTNANFYSMVEIVVFCTETFFLLNEGGTKIEKNDDLLQRGKYYIVTAGSISINNEQWLARTISLQTGIRIHSFRDGVRLRDRRCVVSKKKVLNIDRDEWTGFEAAHIFPLAHEGHWKEHNYDRWVSFPPATGGSINSVQNGILLKSDIHQLFDTFSFSINPDDDYKIVYFTREDENIAGTHLDRQLLDDPQRPADELLRWHFRQSVLANMRGGGEPIFEHDFPPGSDNVGDILRGPKATERMEFELFNRFAAQIDLFAE